MNNHKRLPAILDELREYGDTPPPPNVWCDLVERMIDAWHKYEQTNTAALRTAIFKIKNICGITDDAAGVAWNEGIAANVLRVIEEACATPSRNIDLYENELDAAHAYNEWCRKSDCHDCQLFLKDCMGIPCAMAWVIKPVLEEHHGNSK